MNLKLWRDRRLLAAAGCLAVLLVGMCDLLFQRMQSGRLFLFALSWDSPASPLEQLDAVASARLWRVPALIVLVILCGIGFWIGRRWRAVRWSRPGQLLLSCLMVATLADLGSTLYFFHMKGIDLEVHPAIRLCGYAFGRTVGPVLAKGIQLFGILLIGQFWPKWRAQVYAVAGLLMLLATAQNLLN